jgi:DNA-binding transcriptional ArsR family regulator
MNEDRLENGISLDPSLSVEWAPAYELLVSFTSFLARRMHPLLELGSGWVRSVRLSLPADFERRGKQLDDLVDSKEKGKLDDLLWLLVHVCPGPRDASAFLDWLEQLGPGDAYELVAERLAGSSGGLPREFRAWRDALCSLLRIWHTGYFEHSAPAIQAGLRREALALQARLAELPPQLLIEQVTNGLWLEPSPELRQVVLVPQYHCRPFNEFGEQRDGLIVLYSCDVLPRAPGAPPTGLLRLTRGLADESRLRILRFLGASEPRTLTEVARFARLTQPTVHHHLAQLRAAGLVRVHVILSGPSRYSLSPHALGALASQLGTYLEPDRKRDGV